MKYRIAIWAGAGLLVAGFWAVYLFVRSAIPMTPAEPVWNLVRLTCPVMFAGFYFHFPISICQFFLANTATYALTGLIAETLRQRLNPAK